MEMPRMKRTKSKRWRSMIGLLACILLGTTNLLADTVVLVEAEAFKDTGGWVNDSQFMDQMRSSFLLAHGLGRPVEDAETTVQVPSHGKYHVWARTRGWVAQWTKGTSMLRARSRCSSMTNHRKRFYVAKESHRRTGQVIERTAF
jgi:hypothetical protein